MRFSGQDTFLLGVLESPWLGPLRSLFVMCRLMKQMLVQTGKYAAQYQMHTSDLHAVWQGQVFPRLGA